MLAHGSAHKPRGREDAGYFHRHHPALCALRHSGAETDPTHHARGAPDSRIVIQSLDKRYVKEERYNDYLQQILPLVDACKLLYWKWIPDKENKFTDQIARQALRRKGGNCYD